MIDGLTMAQMGSNVFSAMQDYAAVEEDMKDSEFEVDEITLIFDFPEQYDAIKGEWEVVIRRKKGD